jgi:hypothetical protein
MRSCSLSLTYWKKTSRNFKRHVDLEPLLHKFLRPVLFDLRCGSLNDPHIVQSAVSRAFRHGLKPPKYAGSRRILRSIGLEPCDSRFSGYAKVLYRTLFSVVVGCGQSLEWFPNRSYCNARFRAKVSETKAPNRRSGHYIATRIYIRFSQEEKINFSR